MAVAANALTTLAKVKDILGISDATYDTRLERLINAASDLFEKLTNREYALDAAREDTIAAYGTHALLVSLTPINSLTSITFNGSTVDLTEVTFDADTGEIFQPGGWGWTAHTAADIVQQPLPGTEQRPYVVTYSGGYVLPAAGSPTLPDDIEDAVIGMVATRFNSTPRDATLAGRKLLSFSETYHPGNNGQSGIPPYAQTVINSWRRLS